jgi:hypothetical protein
MMYGGFAGAALGLVLLLAGWTSSHLGLCALQFILILCCGIGGGLLAVYKNRRRIVATLLGLGAALAVFAGCYFLLVLLGIVTGVIAPCATAPEWWITAFLWLAYSMPIWGGIAALYCGWKVLRWHESRHTQASHCPSILMQLTSTDHLHSPPSVDQPGG